MSFDDNYFMAIAIRLAKAAAERDEVPVGALVTFQNRIISVASNRKVESGLVTGHAEILAIEQASKALNNWRLSECDLYVTLEPCLMCAGAIYQSRIRRVVFATNDPKAGAFGSLYDIHKDQRLNHNPSDVCSGNFQEESSKLLKDFFSRKRS